MKKDSCVYLLHIRDAVECIKRYTEHGEKHFLKDEKTQDAVLYNLAIIGEAVKKLPKDFRSAHPSIPWKDIAGTRDIIIHEYDSMAIAKIWNVVTRDLPVLGKAINSILKELGNIL